MFLKKFKYVVADIYIKDQTSTILMIQQVSPETLKNKIKYYVINVCSFELILYVIYMSLPNYHRM